MNYWMPSDSMGLCLHLTDPPWLDWKLASHHVYLTRSWLRGHIALPAPGCAQHIFIERVLLFLPLITSQWKLLIHLLPTHQEGRWTFFLLPTVASKHHSSFLIKTNNNYFSLRFVTSVMYPSQPHSSYQVLPILTWMDTHQPMVQHHPSIISPQDSTESIAGKHLRMAWWERLG